ncbi:hypothetical protein [Streptomyces sp. NBC_00557]|uniref:hypothetical protein n=1 Tax=Streptomyces sp. NBC_00557 TaxID=2975776 RepID=UPI002E808DC1|nr:hypothetical protein [Streptomyces sp. NBC_00557]WUC34097.1 hypothetical protein OG956_07695 [Streptomyces sp. NBC_00557]
MTRIVLPHEVHGDGARKAFAVHGWSGLPGSREARDASGACTAAGPAGEKERR